MFLKLKRHNFIIPKKIYFDNFGDLFLLCYIYIDLDALALH